MTKPDQSRLDQTPGDGRTADGGCTHELFSQAYPALPRSLAKVRMALARYATEMGAGSSLVEAVRLAASEAATNVVVHAYGEADLSGLIHVEASVDDGELRVSVADDGPGLRAREDSPGPALGLSLIAALADNVQMLQGSDGGLRVLMRFALTRR